MTINASFDVDVAETLSDYVSELRHKLDQLESKYSSLLKRCPSIDIGIIAPHNLQQIILKNDWPDIIVPVYSSPFESELRAVGQIIEFNSLNERKIIYPDIQRGAHLLASAAKVIDTVICSQDLPRFQVLETGPIWDEASAQLHAKKNAIRHIGRVISQERLNDQSRSGSISVRGSGDGFLITATKTQKDIVGDSLVNVHRFDVDTNTMHCCGGIPSASSAMHATIYRNCPEAAAIVHVHCKDMTYSPNLEHLRSREFVPDGYSPEFLQILPSIIEHGFAVLKGHGEIAIGANLDDAVSRIRNYLRAAQRKENVNAIYHRPFKQVSSG